MTFLTTALLLLYMLPPLLASPNIDITEWKVQLVEGISFRVDETTINSTLAALDKLDTVLTKHGQRLKRNSNLMDEYTFNKPLDFEKQIYATLLEEMVGLRESVTGLCWKSEETSRQKRGIFDPIGTAIGGLFSLATGKDKEELLLKLKEASEDRDMIKSVENGIMKFEKEAEFSFKHEEQIISNHAAKIDTLVALTGNEFKYLKGVEKDMHSILFYFQIMKIINEIRLAIHKYSSIRESALNGRLSILLLPEKQLQQHIISLSITHRLRPPIPQDQVSKYYPLQLAQFNPTNNGYQVLSSFPLVNLGMTYSISTSPKEITKEYPTATYKLQNEDGGFRYISRDDLDSCLAEHTSKTKYCMVRKVLIIDSRTIVYEKNSTAFYINLPQAETGALKCKGEKNQNIELTLKNVLSLNQRCRLTTSSFSIDSIQYFHNFEVAHATEIYHMNEEETIEIGEKAWRSTVNLREWSYDAHNESNHKIVSIKTDIDDLKAWKQDSEDSRNIDQLSTSLDEMKALLSEQEEDKTKDMGEVITKYASENSVWEWGQMGIIIVLCLFVLFLLVSKCRKTSMIDVIKAKILGDLSKNAGNSNSSNIEMSDVAQKYHDFLKANSDMKENISAVAARLENLEAKFTDWEVEWNAALERSTNESVSDKRTNARLASRMSKNKKMTKKNFMLLQHISNFLGDMGPIEESRENEASEEEEEEGID